MVAGKSVYQPLDESDTLFESVQDFDFRVLAGMFDLKNPNSEFSVALKHLQIENPDSDEAFFIQESGQTLFNLSLFLQIVSAGSVNAVEEQGLIHYQKKLGLFKIFKLIGLQARVEKYLAPILDGSVTGQSTSDFAKRAHSLALGLCMNILLQRFGAGAKPDFARWLADIANAPLRHRTTLVKIQKIQTLRTRLSSAFAFTQTITNKRVDERSHVLTKFDWKGQPVCAGAVQGPVLRIRSLKDVPVRETLQNKILLFQYAKPDAVNFFEPAAGVLFASGGVLSHACVVAREMGKPAITALGPEFWSQVSDGTFIAMDGLNGTVTVHREKLD